MMRRLCAEYRDDLIIIFGSGKFGKIAFSHFEKTNPCIVIDNKKDSEFCENTIKCVDNFNSFLETYRINSYSLDQNVFIQGSIEILSNLLSEVIPKYLIPVAPIHLMLELLKQKIPCSNVALTSETVIHKVIADRLISVPKNLNISNFHNNNIYFSYAKETEICPENCIGPITYCPTYNRDKPETVSDFVHTRFNNLKSSILLEFVSDQIIAGLGGISGRTIINEMKKIQDISGKMFIIVATTCNCHGVVSVIPL